MIRIVIDIFLVLGCFFAFAGVVGMIRMPDSFSRMQSSTNIATFGVIWTCIGAAIYAFTNGNTALGTKAILIGVFIVLTTAVAGHAIMKAGYIHGIKPDNMVVDEYGRDNPNE
ncbi:Na(+)/H(+) antiporter subunit G [Caloramator mitchellensis]|uniref:Na(+)/H(+) antiporter subunit G n=1 Tax=Caloramator mitchellensis TaxID=908809 RepID=A0A0R3K2R6_CALMK|nr:monovalent cation/H(+) antiporter subunit G [Caloramator mitchellensis]KRQ86607.1 Na(+)/H(+) antiporter subunit G [Caloramator mitchellensis]